MFKFTFSLHIYKPQGHARHNLLFHCMMFTGEIETPQLCSMRGTHTCLDLHCDLEEYSSNFL